MFSENNFPISLTFDVDWAPDCAIECCVDILKTHQIPATFFITHQSPILSDLLDDPMFEVGIHPNFLANSSHGSTWQSVMEFCMNLVPNATCMRTHGLFQSSGLLFFIMKEFSQIQYDFSLFLPHNPHCKPFVFPQGDHQIIRTPHQWEDDLYFFEKSDAKDIVFSQANYQMFDFHPIYVYLNSHHAKAYNQLKETLNRPLFELTKSELLGFKNESNQSGSRQWLEYVIFSTSKDRFVHASVINGLMQGNVC